MSSPRLRRLKADFSAVREAFADDPHVSVEPYGSADPPETYRVTFNVRGLRREGDRPELADTHQVEVRLPLGYPAEPPYCVPLTPLFHPNVQGYFCTADHWAPDASLVEVMVRLGEMIQWRDYNIDSPLDAEAASWAKENVSADFLPIGDVDLHRPVPASEGSGGGDDKGGERIDLRPNPEGAAEAPGDDIVVVRSK